MEAALCSDGREQRGDTGAESDVCECLFVIVECCITFQTSDLFISLLESLNTETEPDQHRVRFADNTYNILDVSCF